MASQGSGTRLDRAARLSSRPSRCTAVHTVTAGSQRAIQQCPLRGGHGFLRYGRNSAPTTPITVEVRTSLLSSNHRRARELKVLRISNLPVIISLYAGRVQEKAMATINWPVQIGWAGAGDSVVECFDPILPCRCAHSCS